MNKNNDPADGRSSASALASSVVGWGRRCVVGRRGVVVVIATAGCEGQHQHHGQRRQRPPWTVQWLRHGMNPSEPTPELPGGRPGSHSRSHTPRTALRAARSATRAWS